MSSRLESSSVLGSQDTPLLEMSASQEGGFERPAHDEALAGPDAMVVGIKVIRSRGDGTAWRALA